MTDTADMRVRVQAKIRLEAVLIALDIRCLGRGGWPIGALVDPLVQHAGVGEMRLLRPALSDLSPWCTTTGLRPVASPADARPARHFVIRALTRSARYVRRESAALGLGWPTAYCCNSHRGDCMGFGAQPQLFTLRQACDLSTGKDGQVIATTARRTGPDRTGPIARHL